MVLAQQIFKERMILPFIGSLIGEYDLFEYLIHSLNERQIEIVSPSWLVNRCSLQNWDLVNLHIAFTSGDHIFSQGKVENVKWDEELNTNVYELSFLNTKPLQQNEIHIALEGDEAYVKITEDISIPELLTRNIKQALLLKEGIFIYLKHMIPYFSRITGYDNEQYSQVELLIFEDIKKNLQGNIQNLRSLYESLSQNPSNILEFFNLENLREMLESEINIDLLNLIFHDDAHVSYITAIKELEEKLYWYNNKIVILLYNKIFQN